MNFLYKSIQTLSLNLNLNPNLPPPSFHHQTPLHPPKPTTTGFRQCRRSIPPTLASDHPASMSEIDMVPNKEGIFTAKPKKVVILWDLDNKPPRGPPYDAALSLINIATHFGEVVDVSAYANRHAFVHLPHWVRDQRRDQRRQDFLERKGAVTPPEPYICSVCGRKCKTNLDLKKHFKQLHLREREKKMNRMKSLKGKKRQRFKERFISSDHKYMEAARTLITPRVGYGLAAELRRAGVFVKTVEDKPQAADWALKRQMQHSMSRGIDWLVLVSDDSDFVEMLKRARGSNLGTVVVGDWDRALGRQADLWVPWNRVENGEITEEDLVIRRRSGEDVDDVNAGAFVSDFDERGMSLDGVLDELVRERNGFNQSKISMFSEGEEEDDDDESDYLSDSDDDEEDDWYI
ncbi:putative transcription factor C2H2 family [Helianthus annuus]|uniref:Putative C2H2-like zinc finger protein n=1 Tax=Helianthus annuus TaxID=4232 RepID=A0A251TY03_HELAN|nr:uncharacterized protein LOC110879353 [Helianthus annuus]KAF5792223.1 putative transcription factor C2H2 family [Helianthus annuus]KAJ0527188.1 putative transcription factor C2H2 family [Helianthus annuus]KAJ0543593.1 putative transcription factor C2H2 family [Helianthus annuus]KAJ0708647.1 putative transcription factor C2H2 family [Helianthus annuus]KAJ0754580.1 putative transcription factor C2H2 family [Helianthus annuus]